MQGDSGVRVPLLLLCASGVALRFVFLLLAGDLEFRADEATYVYLGVSWNHFGVYPDSHRYLWPPGYPFYLARWLAALELPGLFWAKFFQVLASASIGASVVLMARRVFGRRAAVIAGVIWCVYLPLVGFTHYLRTETLFLALFLPALLQLLAFLQESRPRDARLFAAGALFALALHLKESPVYLAPLLALGLVHAARSLGIAEGLRRASLFLLAATVVALPWSLRNAEVYGRFVGLGTSLGENMHVGMNEVYKNYDLTPFTKHFFLETVPENHTRRWFVEAEEGSGWERAEEIHNTPDRLAENVRRGLTYAREHPGWLLRSRIKKLADLVVPFSFFVRRQGLDAYGGGPLGAPGLRRTLVVWALLAPVVVMLLAIPGFFAVRDGASRWLIATVVLYFVATSLVNSMSRIRIPMVPLWIVLAGGALAHGPARLRELRTLAPVGALWALLLFLWWVDAPELVSVVDVAWNPRSPS